MDRGYNAKQPYERVPYTKPMTPGETIAFTLFCITK
jgi:hypothetical protein